MGQECARVPGDWQDGGPVLSMEGKEFLLEAAHVLGEERNLCLCVSVCVLGSESHFPFMAEMLL